MENRSVAVFGIISVLGLLVLSAFAVPTIAETSCRHGIGVSRTIFLNTQGGARFGASHGEHRDFLKDREVVLTFDDGPVPGKTDKVLDALKRHCTKATFFMVGRMVANYPGLVKKVLSEGHTIGAHTYSHRNLRQTNTTTAINDVNRSIQAINAAAGRNTSAFFRFPYLSENHHVSAMLNQRDYGIFAIDVDSKDYRFRNSNSMVNRIMMELKRTGKGIILMHDTKTVTANGIGQLLMRLNDAGYKIVHVRGFQGKSIEESDLVASAQTSDDSLITGDINSSDTIQASLAVPEFSGTKSQTVTPRKKTHVKMRVKPVAQSTTRKKTRCEKTE